MYEGSSHLTWNFDHKVSQVETFTVNITNNKHNTDKYLQVFIGPHPVGCYVGQWLVLHSGRVPAA